MSPVLYQRRPVASCRNARSGHAQLSFFPWADGSTFFVHHFGLYVGASLADREWPGLIGWNAGRELEIRAHIRFRRTVQIEIPRVGKKRFQGAQMFDGKHFAGKVQNAQRFVIVLRKVSVLCQ